MHAKDSFHEQINILHIASGDLLAGAETQLYYLTTALNNFPNIRLHVVLLNDGVLNQKLTEKGVAVTVFDENKFNAFVLLFKITKLVYQLNVDVIHTHRFKENILGGIASMLNTHAKCIKTVHGASEDNILSTNIRKRALNRIDKLIERYVTKFIIFVSHDLRDRLVKFKDKKQIIIENGVDFDEINKNSTQSSFVYEKNNIKKVLFIGRLVPVKRIDIYLDIAKIIKDDGDVEIKFYIIGDGPLKSEIREIIKDKKLENIVFELGFLSNPLPDLNNMDCMIITSDHEGLPMTLLEAMCLKVLVISHNVGGISKLLGNGDCGILLDTQDPMKYVAALKKIFSDDKLYENLVSQGYKKVVDNYSSVKNAKKYIEIYQKIISKH